MEFLGTTHILFYYLKQRFQWDMKIYAYLKAPSQTISTLAVSIFDILSAFLDFVFISALKKLCIFRLDFGHYWIDLKKFGPILASNRVGHVFGVSKYRSTILISTTIIVVVIDMLTRFSPAALRSMLSKSVSPEEQGNEFTRCPTMTIFLGRLFSLISVAELACSLLSSVIFHTLFPYSIPFFPQLSFVLMGSIVFIPILLIWYNFGKKTYNVVLAVIERNCQTKKARMY